MERRVWSPGGEFVCSTSSFHTGDQTSIVFQGVDHAKPNCSSSIAATKYKRQHLLSL